MYCNNNLKNFGGVIMKYVNQKTNSQKSFVEVMLGKLLAMVDEKLSNMQELAIKEGNQNWKKSKLAIIFLTMKKLVMQILTLRKNKPTDKALRKIWKQKIKQLLLQLKVTVKLANDEMQIQKEKVLVNEKLKEKQKIFTPFELMLLQQKQNVR